MQKILRLRRLDTYLAAWQRILEQLKPFEPWLGIVVVIGLVAGAAVLRMGPLHVFELRLPWVTFYPAVFIAALYGGLFTGFLATILSSLAVSLWIPNDKPFIGDPGDWFGMGEFITICMTISIASEVVRRARARTAAAKKQLGIQNLRLQEANEHLTREIAEHRLAQEVLRESKDRLKDICRSVGEGIVCIDARQHIVLFNAAAERIFGYAAAEMIGQSINVLLPERFGSRHE